MPDAAWTDFDSGVVGVTARTRAPKEDELFAVLNDLGNGEDLVLVEASAPLREGCKILNFVCRLQPQAVEADRLRASKIIGSWAGSSSRG